MLVWSLIQSCPLSADAVGIFDNIVERASRENDTEFGLVNLTSYILRSFRASEGV